jgi:hypothetical protein
MRSEIARADSAAKFFLDVCIPPRTPHSRRGFSTEEEK